VYFDAAVPQPSSGRVYWWLERDAAMIATIEPRSRGGSVMAYYRLYFLNARGSHIERFTSFDAASDADAIRVAEGHHTRDAMEAWSGGRLVRRFQDLRPVPFVKSDPI
jgi:hypothetical protein